MHILTRRAALLTAAAAGATRPGPARAATTISVAYIPILAMAQLFIIAGEGWLKSEGIELQLTRFSSGPAMVQALVSGGYDVAYIGIGPAMVARGSGLPLKIVAANGIDGGSLIGRGTFAEIFKAAHSPAEAFASFRQREGRPVRIATLPKGSVPETVLQYWLGRVLTSPSFTDALRCAKLDDRLPCDAVEAALILGASRLGLDGPMSHRISPG